MATKKEQELQEKPDWVSATEEYRAANGQPTAVSTQTQTSTGSSVNSGGQYIAADPTGVDNYHAKNTANNGMGMSASDLALLESYGQAYNTATNDAQRAAAHAAAEALRQQYGYSGGDDGSEYIATAQPTVTTPTFGSFSYSDAPSYTDNYSARIDAMLNEILNRDKFSYNAEEDALYQQYKDQYQREGQRAMKDTLGQVAARTGGLASSYAVSAAQQQNNYYMQQLSDKIPELYQLAYQMYLDDIDLQVQDLGLLQGASDTAYNRYRDTMSDWRDDRDFAYGMYRDDIGDQKWSTEFNYGAIRDVIGDSQWQQNYDRGVYESDRDYDRDVLESDRDYDRGVLESDRDYEYTVGRDNADDSKDAADKAYDRAMDLLSLGVMPEPSVLNAAGLTETQANAILAGIVTPDDGGPGMLDDYEGNEGLTTDQVKALQSALGVETDGRYGPASQKAAGGLTAKEAYNKYVTGKAQVETTDDQVGNNHADSWVYVPGLGRLSWQELESYVDSGKVKESIKDGKYWYTQAG